MIFPLLSTPRGSAVLRPLQVLVAGSEEGGEADVVARAQLVGPVAEARWVGAPPEEHRVEVTHPYPPVLLALEERERQRPRRYAAARLRRPVRQAGRVCGPPE